MNSFNISSLPGLSKTQIKAIEKTGLTFEDIASPNGLEWLIAIRGIGEKTALPIIGKVTALLEYSPGDQGGGVVDRAKSRLGKLLDKEARRIAILSALSETVANLEEKTATDSAQVESRNTVGDLLADIQKAGPIPPEESFVNWPALAREGMSQAPTAPIVYEGGESKPPEHRPSTAVYQDAPGEDSPRAAEAKNTPHGGYSG